MAEQALYRKWRPAAFEEVVGQEHVIKTIQNALASGRAAHAYLFSGPRGTGKTSTARLVAKALNCTNPDPHQRPDNTCSHCIALNEGRFLDLIEIDAASNTGVDNIRDLRDKINFSPGEGIYKVYVIDEVHMLSIGAFNALLKTLEEPPAHAIFILATTELHKVPLTVASRCQKHAFRRIPAAEVARRLQDIVDREGLHVEPAVLDVLAAIAGRPAPRFRIPYAVAYGFAAASTAFGSRPASAVSRRRSAARSRISSSGRQPGSHPCPKRAARATACSLWPPT